MAEHPRPTLPAASQPATGPQGSKNGQARLDREADALRLNLLRRKQQSRDRQALAKPPDPKP